MPRQKSKRSVARTTSEEPAPSLKRTEPSAARPATRDRPRVRVSAWCRQPALTFDDIPEAPDFGGVRVPERYQGGIGELALRAEWLIDVLLPEVSKQIADLLDIPDEQRAAFTQKIAEIILYVDASTFISSNIPFTFTRRKVASQFDALIAALEPFTAENEWPFAAMYFFHGAEFSTNDDLQKINDEAFKFFNILMYQARRAKEIATRSPLLRDAGSPRGARRHPGLDLFIYFFLGTAQRFKIKTTAWIDHRTGTAKGSLIDVLQAVKPCFGKNFLPSGKSSGEALLSAIKRARRLPPNWQWHPTGGLYAGLGDRRPVRRVRGKYLQKTNE
jgi:hypothetical protein